MCLVQLTKLTYLSVFKQEYIPFYERLSPFCSFDDTTVGGFSLGLFLGVSTTLVFLLLWNDLLRFTLSVTRASNA